MCPGERGQRGPAEVRSQEIGHFYNIIINIIIIIIINIIIIIIIIITQWK